MRDEPRDTGGRFRRRPGGGGSNGSSPEGMHTQPISLDDVRAEPFDLVAVQADDELINALAGGMTVTAPGYRGYDADDHVAAMLAAWKADVDADPLPEIDLDAATAAVLAGRRPSGRGRHLVPIAGAAALIVVAVTGVSIGAQDARPGDALFSISKVLYHEQAVSYEALATVEQSQEKVKQALAVGDKDTAAAAVAEGQAAAISVLAEHGHGEVMQELHQLEVEVDNTIPGVPNTPDEDEPPARTREGDTGPSGQQAAPGAGPTTSTTTTAPQQSRGGTTDESGTPEGPGDGGSGDPRRAAAPESDGTDAGGSGSGKPGGGNDEPGGGTDEPDPPSDSSGSGPSAQPSGSGSGSGSTEPDPPSDDGAPSTPSTSAPASSGAPSAPASGGAPAPGGDEKGEGVSGASMTTTGTATPSGEPAPAN